MSARVEHYGDEGELHIARGWRISRDEVCVQTRDDIVAQVGQADAADYLEGVEPANVKRGWALFVPEKHPLDKWGGDGGVITSRSLFPPVWLHYDGKRLAWLVGRPATWLRDH